MEFQTFHRYNRLVRRGLAQPILCNCGQEPVLKVGRFDEPVLECFFCGMLTVPGQAMYDDLLAVVKEHDV